MIKCDEGRTEIKGTAIELIAELTTLMKSLRELSDVFDDDCLHRCVEISGKTEEEVEEKIKENLKEMDTQNLIDFLTSLLKL